MQAQDEIRVCYGVIPKTTISDAGGQSGER